ncbi:MAG: hypothetical protein IT384_33230 [Deltaproteobacteria bacterium]|nr:hypothetical protein [Deltaproteobacteria bacterium]
MVDPLGSPVVLDASVLINLIATEVPGELLESLDVDVVVREQAWSEVTRDPRGRGPPALVLDPLRAAGNLSVVPLEGVALATFMELVSAPSPDDLGDGESATIAHAVASGWAAALDDKKAIRILRARSPTTRQIYTVDIFALAKAKSSLSAKVVDQAFDDALRFARMRVPK